MKITFTIHGIAQPAGSKRSFVRMDKRTGQPMRRDNGSIVTGTVDDNPKTSDWKNRVAGEARRVYTGPALQGPICLRLTFQVTRPKGHFGKKGLRDSAPQWPTVRPDVTKLVRGTEDALKGILWLDDAQVVRQEAMKCYGPSAWVEVHVEELM